jgi:exopolysaccharide biosynthesis polyprenyl glycosylphosphotransferase
MHGHAQRAVCVAEAPPPVPRLSLAVQSRLLAGWLMLSDLLALLAAFTVAYWLRFDLQITIAPEVVPHPAFYPLLGSILPLLWLAVFSAVGLYDAQKKIGGLEETARAFNACTTAAMLVIMATFLQPEFVVSRMWLVSAWLLSFLAVATNRFLARRLVASLRQQGFLLRPAVMVGMNEESVALAASLNDWRSSGVRLVGVLASSCRALRHEVPGVPLLGSSRDVAAIVTRLGIEDVVVAITAVDREELLQVGEDLNPLPHVSLRLSSGLYELLTTRVTVQHFGTLPLLRLDKIRLAPVEALLKATLDYSLTTALLILLTPVLLVIAVLIKLDSPGPVLYRRRVLGGAQAQFDAFKFRTMYVDGDALLAAHPDAQAALKANHKLQHDPRVTRIGQWLRAASLDELPQLFNVLRAEMSLVGPRMITPEELEKYGRLGINLHTVKPGITGLWQVSGRSDLSYEERVRLDMYYVRNYSIWMDLQILFVQTIPAVLKRRGAY